MVSCFCMWVSSPRHLRYRDVPNVVVIVACLKLIYFNDNEKGMNNIIEPELMDTKAFAQEIGQYLMVIPLVLCVFLENKIARHYSLGTFHKLQSHSLTAALIVYELILARNKYILSNGLPKTADEIALRNERDNLASAIGFMIYFGVGACMLMTTVHVKFILGKTWDNVSVRCGLLLVKAAMMVGGKLGPMVYFCLILQIYNFALIVNKRRDDNPGQTLVIQIFFAFCTMHLYYLRTSHRDRMSSI